MAKMYLFRKLSEPHQPQQSDVCEEAASSVLDDVLKGNTGTIFNYGDWPGYSSRTDEMRRDNEMEKQNNMIERIFCDLFRRVYSMEATLEINISIRHMQLNAMQKQLLIQTDDGQCSNEHFVATPHEVYVYIEKVIGQLQQQRDSTNRPANGYPYLLFSICVSQTNLDHSLQLHGRLQVVQVQEVDRSETMPDTPMASLLRIIRALSINPKTHLRYYNIRLTRILKDLLESDNGTFIINYSNDPDTQVNMLTISGCAKIWKALYMRERDKYNYLADKLLGLNFYSSRSLARQLEELLDSVKGNKEFELNRGRNICTPRNQKLYSIQDTQLCDELKQIRNHAMVNFDEILQIQQLLTRLAISHAQHTEKMEYKDRILFRLHMLLAENNKRLYRQCITFRRKLTMYSEMFRSLWTEQRQALQLKEQKHETQLSKLFDAFYDELQSTHHSDSLKLLRNCSQPAR